MFLDTRLLRESMQFLKSIEHAIVRITIKEATEPPIFGR
jgi:hypothetical protein